MELVTLVAEQWVPLLFCKKSWAAHAAKNRIWRYQHAENIGYNVEINPKTDEYGSNRPTLSIKWTKHGKVHSLDDMPAYRSKFCQVSNSYWCGWARNGELHRDGNPAYKAWYFSLREDNNGIILSLTHYCVEWFRNGAYYITKNYMRPDPDDPIANERPGRWRLTRSDLDTNGKLITQERWEAVPCITQWSAEKQVLAGDDVEPFY